MSKALTSVWYNSHEEPRRICAWPKCAGVFVPARRDQIYHEARCRNAAAKAAERTRKAENAPPLRAELSRAKRSYSWLKGASFADIAFEDLEAELELRDSWDDYRHDRASVGYLVFVEDSNRFTHAGVKHGGGRGGKRARQKKPGRRPITCDFFET